MKKNQLADELSKLTTLELSNLTPAELLKLAALELSKSAVKARRKKMKDPVWRKAMIERNKIAGKKGSDKRWGISTPSEENSVT